MHSFLKEFLVEDSNSDKLHHHGYHRIYPWFLKHLKNQKIQLLEIGIDQAESIKLWCEYFSEIDIYGLDCAEKNFNHPRVKLYRVDQSQEDQLQSFAKNINTNFDIIIDDGSHVPDHQILTFKHFWSLLKPGGIYIIEDIETSYWGNSSILGYRFNANRSRSNVIEYSKNLVNSVNAEFIPTKYEDLTSEIEMITFAYNSVIFIKKDFQSFSKYYERSYRFSEKINRWSFCKIISLEFHKLLRRLRITK